MAEVFRAKPLDAPDPDRYFAVKRILPHLAEDIEFIKMFVDEAQLTVRLDHRNIVQTYELGQFQASHYIVMEFIAGKDLLAFQKHVRSQQTTVNIDTCCHIMAQIARGLDYAHRRCDEEGNPLNIIHRDVSPQNILVSWDGRVRVIDFGVAKAASQSTKTKAGVLKGKFGYLSPEQVRAEQIDRRSDIFAMGTLFWELLTNRRLFNASNQYETMMLISDPEVERPSSINGAVPEEVDRLAMKALAVDRENRYQWASEFADDLEDFLRRQKPPYHSSQLTTWLRSAFQEEFDEEREKRETFREINSAADVRRVVDGEKPSSPDGDQGAADATQIWDVEQAPESDADIENFVANHTVVAAGGLDLEDYDEWEDAPDTIEEIDALDQGGSPQVEEVPATHEPVRIEESSRFDAEPTVVTGSYESVEARTPVERTGQSTGPQTIDAAMLSPEPVATPESARVSADAEDKKTDRLGAIESEPTPVPQNSEGAEGAEGSDEELSKPLILAATGAMALLVVAGVGAAWVVLSDGEESSSEEEITWGGMVVEAEPSSDLEVYIDDQQVPSQMPLTMEELGAGDYEVRIAHPAYPEWSTMVSVGPGEITRVAANLAEEGELQLGWTDLPEGLELLIDGQTYEPEGQGLEVRLERGEYTVEARAPGIRPVRKGVRVEGSQQIELELEWVANDQLTIYGGDDREVVLDGRSHGQLPLTLTDLALDRTYELEIGDDRGVLGFPLLGREALEAREWAEHAGLEEEAFGWLVIDLEVESLWSLAIDGESTGLTLPLSWEGLPVEEGWREVELQRGEEAQSFRVWIEGEEVTILRADVEG